MYYVKFLSNFIENGDKKSSPKQGSLSISFYRIASHTLLNSPKRSCAMGTRM